MAGHDSDPARRQRARERSERITIVRLRHDEVDPAEPRVDGLAAMALSAELTRAAWALSGRALPTYGRAEIPYVFVPNSKLA